MSESEARWLSGLDGFTWIALTYVTPLKLFVPRVNHTWHYANPDCEFEQPQDCGYRGLPHEYHSGAAPERPRTGLCLRSRYSSYTREDSFTGRRSVLGRLSPGDARDSPEHESLESGSHLCARVVGSQVRSWLSRDRSGDLFHPQLLRNLYQRHEDFQISHRSA